MVRTGQVAMMRGKASGVRYSPGMNDLADYALNELSAGVPAGVAAD